MFIKRNFSREYDSWNLQMIHKFITILMKVTLCKDVMELKNHQFKDCLWKQVAKHMKIDSTSLQNFWQSRLHLQLFCPKPIYGSDLKIKLIEYIYQKGITSRREINWCQVLKYFDGYTSMVLSHTLSYLLKFARKRTSFTQFTDQIEFLYDTYIPQLINAEEDSKLPRVLFTKNKAVHVDMDEIHSDPETITEASSEED